MRRCQPFPYACTETAAAVCTTRAWYVDGRRPERAGLWATMLNEVVAALPIGAALTLVLRRGGGLQPALRVELSANAASLDEAVDHLQAAMLQTQPLWRGGELCLAPSVPPDQLPRPSGHLRPATTDIVIGQQPSRRRQRRGGGELRRLRLDAPRVDQRPRLAHALLALDPELAPAELRWSLAPLRLDAELRRLLAALGATNRPDAAELRALATNGSAVRSTLTWQSRATLPRASLALVGRAVFGTAVTTTAAPGHVDVDLAACQPSSQPNPCLAPDAATLLYALPTVP